MSSETPKKMVRRSPHYLPRPLKLIMSRNWLELTGYPELVAALIAMHSLERPHFRTFHWGYRPQLGP
jgi:hypothetical protein